MAEAASGFDALRRICAAALRGTTVAEAPDAAAAARLLALAERHRVVPLLAAGTAGAAREPFRRRGLALAQQTVRLERELADIAAALACAGVEFLVLKGPALARQAYAEPGLRAYDDLDLWVASPDLETAVRTLEAAGYCRKEPLSPRAAACARRAGIEVALVHPEHRRLVELAHGPAALAPAARAARELLNAAAALDIGGAAVRAPAPVHALLYACLHGAHHGWDRLGWVADVAGCWRRLPPAAQAEVCVTARRWRVETALGLGLRLAADHLGLELAGRAAGLAAAPRAGALAVRAGLERIEPDTTRVPMLERLRFEDAVRDSPARRLQARAGWLFTPTLGDIAAAPLPAALYPLYALLRPLRLLRHPWRRDWRRLLRRG